MKNENERHSIVFLTDVLWFPLAENANPDGLVAVGGDLSPERLLLAYRSGIFPWYNDGSLILWWSPNPRMVLFPREIRITSSMKKVIRDNQFTLTQNTCFQEVMEHCATVPRAGQEGTWITNDMKEAYLRLHEMGWARSYEVWENNKLVGGLYGLDLGSVFCGESMFSTTSNASKFAFIQLALAFQNRDFGIIDCQMHTPHLQSLGAREISRRKFLKLLKDGLQS